MRKTMTPVPSVAVICGKEPFAVSAATKEKRWNMALGSHQRASVCRATAQSGRENVARKSCRLSIAIRYGRKGRMFMSKASSVQPAYGMPDGQAWCQIGDIFETTAKASINRNPRQSFCVPMNQALKIAAVHTPTGE